MNKSFQRMQRCHTYELMFIYLLKLTEETRMCYKDELKRLKTDQKLIMGQKRYQKIVKGSKEQFSLVIK